MKLSVINENIAVFQSEIFVMNSVLIHCGGKGIFIDPGILPEEIKKIDDYLSGNKIEIQDVILTHSHWDHIIAADHFFPAEIIAHQNFEYETSGIKWEHLKKQISDFSKLHEINELEFNIPKPDQLVNREYNLKLNNISLNLTFTPGHASDHISIIIPEQEVLIAGDLLSDREIPYVNYSLKEYIGTLEKLSSFDFEMIIPGHGNSTQNKEEVFERLNRDREYLNKLNELAKTAVNGNLQADDLKNSATKISYPFPELNNYSHLLNLESAFIELGGRADPSKYGWDQNLTEIQ